MEKAKRPPFSFYKKTVIFIIALVLNTILLSALFISASSVVNDLTPKQLHKLMTERHDIIILDIHTKANDKIGYQKEGFGSAIKYSQLPNGLKDLAMYKDRIVVVICPSGVGCKYTGMRMSQNGFKKVYDLKGGVNQWVKDIGYANHQ
jgi:predicted sulfurtransferase